MKIKRIIVMVSLLVAASGSLTGCEEISSAVIKTLIKTAESTIVESEDIMDTMEDQKEELLSSANAEENLDDIVEIEAGTSEVAENDADYYSAATSFTRAEVEAFATQVKAAVVNRDWNTLAALLDDSVNVDGISYSKTEFLAIDFSSRVNDEFISAVEKENCEYMFCSWQGIMLGDGQIWISGVTGQDGTSQLRVIALNSFLIN